MCVYIYTKMYIYVKVFTLFEEVTLIRVTDTFLKWIKFKSCSGKTPFNYLHIINTVFLTLTQIQPDAFFGKFIINILGMWINV